MSFKGQNNRNKDDAFYKASKTDFVIIAIISFFSLACIFGFTHERFRPLGGRQAAYIYQQGKLLEKLSLGEDRVVTLATVGMQVEINGGRVRVARSDCPQHVCMNMGWIRHGGQTLVCAPNKVVVEIKSDGASALDATVY